MTSRPGESLSIVVADANALLAILTGLAASKVLATPVKLHTTHFIGARRCIICHPSWLVTAWIAALALFLDAPVRSNDNHFKGFPTGRYTTAEILKKLGF